MNKIYIKLLLLPVPLISVARLGLRAAGAWKLGLRSRSVLLWSFGA